MSETVQFKGKLKKVSRLAGEKLEEQCRRLAGGVELPLYCDDYAEFIDFESEEYIIYKNSVYHVEKEEIDVDEDLFSATRGANGEIIFDVKYYNGGCSFEEAIEEALNKLQEEDKELFKDNCSSCSSVIDLRNDDFVMKPYSLEISCTDCKDKVKCDYCSEYVDRVRPTPFLSDTGSMCKHCWDETKNEYIASEETSIGNFEDYPHFKK